MNRIPPTRSVLHVRAPRARSLRRALLVALVLLVAPSGARSDTRCGIDLQNDVCLEANPVCPGSTATLGPNPGSWPGFQRDLQHTGWSPFAGPTCNRVLWNAKLKGSVLAAPTLARPTEFAPEVLYVPAGKAPICALDPNTGAVQWCSTDQLGKYVDRSSPAVGNGNMLYVGTRDNDLWAIDVASAASSSGPNVAWRQKVCTDGDVTTPPTIGYNGIVYMGSDSLGAGTFMAMCPGPERQLKWCINPLGGGGIRNASPAMSLNGQRLYVTIGGGTLAAFQPELGTELWRVKFETPRGIGRAPNHAPVVHPVTDIIYLGTDSGIWAIEHNVDEQTGQETASARLLYDTRAARERVYSPPALHPLQNTLVFGASRGNQSSLYAIDLDGNLKWRKPMPRGRFRNNPPVMDVDGRIYVAFAKTLYAFDASGNTLWTLPGLKSYDSSPILANGRLFVGKADGSVTAIGDCTP